MRGFMIGAAALGATLAAGPSYAATNIECMDSGYSAEHEAVIEDFYAKFSKETLKEGSIWDSQFDPISGRVNDCAETYGWLPDAIRLAVFYRVSSMLAHALELKMPLTPEQMDSLNKTLAEADQAKLRKMLGPQIEASLIDEERPGLSEQDKTYLGMLTLRAGLPSDLVYSEYTGALLGARMMAEIAAEQFANF